jgi:hypothetical protein
MVTDASEQSSDCDFNSSDVINSSVWHALSSNCFDLL